MAPLAPALTALWLLAGAAFAQGETSDSFAREVKAGEVKAGEPDNNFSEASATLVKPPAGEKSGDTDDASGKEIQKGEAGRKEAQERDGAPEEAPVQNVRARPKKGKGGSSPSRRSSGGGSSGGGSRRSSYTPPPTTPTNPADAGPPGSPGSRAMKKALKTAESFQRELRQAEDPGPGETMGKIGSGPSNPANPQTPQDLALASVSGFSASFRALGLKAAVGPAGEAAITRADGSAASQEDLAKLSNRIASEPAALMRQPDFLKVLPRKRFETLKSEYAAKPELRATEFKHMGMTDGGRDFQWADSCTRLSGQCNPNARSLSYKKGDDVPAEDLGAVWAKLAEEDEEGASSEYTDEEQKERDERRRQREAGSRRLDLSAAARMLSSLSSDLSKLFGGGSRAAAVVANPSGDFVPAARDSGGSRATVATGEGPTRGLRVASLPSPAQEASQARPMGRAWLLLIIGILLTLAAEWRRRRR